MQLIRDANLGPTGLVMLMILVKNDRIKMRITMGSHCRGTKNRNQDEVLFAITRKILVNVVHAVNLGQANRLDYACSLGVNLGHVALK